MSDPLKTHSDMRQAAEQKAAADPEYAHWYKQGEQQFNPRLSAYYYYGQAAKEQCVRTNDKDENAYKTGWLVAESAWLAEQLPRIPLAMEVYLEQEIDFATSVQGVRLTGKCKIGAYDAMVIYQINNLANDYWYEINVYVYADGVFCESDANTWTVPYPFPKIDIQAQGNIFSAISEVNKHWWAVLWAESHP